MSSLQPENILMVYPPRDEIKICDFGFCQEIDTSRHQYSMFGTPEFVAPEVVHLEPVTVATDIWWVLLQGQEPEKYFLSKNIVLSNRAKIRDTK